MSQRSFKTRKKRERKRQHASKQVRRERSKKAQASTLSTAAAKRITVCVKAPRPESEEASMNTAQKYQQTLRKLGAQMKQLVEEDEDFFVPGFTPSRVTVDKYGQVKHRLVKMSAYFQQVLTMCENLVHNPAVLPGLAAYCPGMKRKDVRTYTAQVLAVLLCSSEFEGGRIGYLQVGAEMNPKSHRELMKEYLLRFGQEINEETWYAAYGRLKKAGYIQDMKVTLPIDLPREGQENLTLIRSAAAYKQFTPRFFEHFKVTRFENVKALIQAGIAKQKAQGYGFKWVSYSILAKGIRDRIQAQFLNELINDTSPVVGTHTSPDIPIPY